MSREWVPYVPPPRYRLSDVERSRVLRKLREAELAVMFTEAWTDDFKTDVWRWEASIRAGWIDCAEVPRLKALFDSVGVA